MIHVILYADDSILSGRVTRALRQKAIRFVRVPADETEPREYIRAFPTVELIGLQRETEAPECFSDGAVPAACMETLHSAPDDNELSGEPLSFGAWLRIARMDAEQALAWIAAQQKGHPVFDGVPLNEYADRQNDRPVNFLYRTRRMTRSEK